MSRLDNEFCSLFGGCEGADEILEVWNNGRASEFGLCARDAKKLGEPAWERLGSYIAGNEHLKELDFDECGLDDSKLAALFRGLTSSDTLRDVSLGNEMFGLVHNAFGIRGVRSMVPFLKESPNLTSLSFCDNGSIDTECFDLLLESLNGGAIERLDFDGCSVESLMALGRCTLPKLRELCLMSNGLSDIIPAQALANCTHLTQLTLSHNKIGEGGFRAVANLLRKQDCSLTHLYIKHTDMNDTEAEIIADSLRCNKKLEGLNVTGNIFGPEGLTAFLKLLNDVSSVDRAGSSNHTLRELTFQCSSQECREITKHIKGALIINGHHHSNPIGAGRAKVLKTLLDRDTRMEIMRLQGIEHSSDHYLFSGIDPVLLPNVLGFESWSARTGGLSELYRMLLVVAPDLVSLIDRRALLQRTKARNKARLAAIAAEEAMLTAVNSRIEKELVSIEADEGTARQFSGKKRSRAT